MKSLSVTFENKYLKKILKSPTPNNNNVFNCFAKQEKKVTGVCKNIIPNLIFHRENLF